MSWPSSNLKFNLTEDLFCFQENFRPLFMPKLKLLWKIEYITTINALLILISNVQL